MKKLILSFGLVLPVLASAQTTLFSFGESTTLVTANENLRDSDGTAATNADINRAFTTSTTLMSPSSDYTGPDFFGGWETTGTLAANFDFGPIFADNQTAAGGNDAIFFTPDAVTGQSGSLHLLLLGGSVATDLSDLNDFTISALRTTGAGNSANARAVIRIGTDYYVGGFNGNNVTGAYAQSSLDTTSWFQYDPTTSISSIGSAATLNASDQVDAVGFLLTRGVNSSNGGGNMRFWVGQFEATAIPEPSAFALISGSLALAWIMVRRRK